ncbi:hypothetical protein MANES_10G068750v8 [Manihot esculenta]|uniref:Uncharacterized protein n=1 Tax=Manihot esculenta TaxID=3983 RepID=A0ACB7H0X5_MANES|nr:hypothetical protein MANES_10G068750v8 [Manihot esculenta]
MLSDVNHVLLHCPLARESWVAIGLVFNFSDVLNMLSHVFSLGDDVLCKDSKMQWVLEQCCGIVRSCLLLQSLGIIWVIFHLGGAEAMGLKEALS